MRRMCFALVVIMLFTTCVHAAMLSSTSMDLSYSGTTANCQITVREANASIDVTMELYRGSTLVKSWSKSGTNRVSLNKTWTCISGQAYTLEADVTVNGISVNVTPITKTCPQDMNGATVNG